VRVSTPALHRPLLGLRRQPGRLALAAMRLPRAVYDHGWGGLLGHTFLLIVHRGRRSAERRETVAMAAAYDAAAREVVVCSAWGETQWLRNLRAHAALEIRIGGDVYVPEQRFLGEAEAAAVVAEFRARHPWRLRLIAAILGWGDLGGDPALRAFVRERPFVAFRPAAR
jgi:deazaflavin-dependent oxidoreductase (nitroreductase family)